jgi:hypothetical protein
MKSMFTTKRSKVLADGGMMQEGGTVDNISGNKVPVGSTKEEVRDDIDAKLSVGEYVFPADVTRYYGIAKLEAMRKEAQDSLKEMESGGRMGNAEQVSDEASSAYDEDKFANEIDDSIAEYDKEQGYNTGGIVKKYEAGGAVAYDPAVSQEVYKRAPIKGFEMIPMSDDKGNVIYIPFINGKPQLKVPEGFAIRAKTIIPTDNTTGTTATTTTTTTTPVEQPRGGSGGREKGEGLGYTPTSGLTAPGAISLTAGIQQGLSAYGSALGGILPLALPAKLAAWAMLPAAISAESEAVQRTIDNNIATFGPSYAGANYGTPVSLGGYGVTGLTGAGIAANPMGIDPATAQGQQAIMNKAIQLSIDKNIDPNDALRSVMDGIVSDANNASNPTNNSIDGSWGSRDAGGITTGAPAANPMSKDPSQTQGQTSTNAGGSVSTGGTSTGGDTSGGFGAANGSTAGGSQGAHAGTGNGTGNAGGDGGSTSGGSAAGAAARGGMGFGGTGSGVGGDGGGGGGD